MAKAETKGAVLEAADKLGAAIGEYRAGLPYDIGVVVDKDETKQPGWKFFEYELTGIPIRIEIGPRDLEKGTCVMTRRDEGKKEFVPLTEVPERVAKVLASMQKELLEKARAFREANTFEIDDYTEFKKKIDEPGGFFVSAWCQSKDCEAKVKEETKATIRCLPLDAKFQPFAEKRKCLACGSATDTNVRAVFAKSY
jgi:prolyl-tRNA synthetase